MEVADRHRVPITEASQVGHVRRLATELARELSFVEPDVGRVGIAVTEAGTNLVKHARHGEMLLRTLSDGQARGVGIMALDRGPGIRNLPEAVRDGFSTAGSPGTGLGAIARQASSFDIYSLLASGPDPSQGCGTALAAQFWAEKTVLERRRLLVGAVCVPVAGEEICGDGWAVVRTSERTIVLVADGLGHGPSAAEAASRAVSVLQANAQLAPSEVLKRVHEALRPTRGAAAAVAELDRRDGLVRFAGIGNIAGTILDGGATRSVVSHHGTLGHDVRKIQEFTYPWPAGATLVMHSDGLVSHWSLERYPGLTQRDPMVVAGVLYRDFRRGRDDTTVVVLREPA